MKRSLFAASLLSLALASVGIAQGAASSPETGAQYTQAQLKQLALTAHAPEQYRALASYYGGQRESYLQQAAKAKKEWAQLSQNVTSHASKYPLPADSARNLYESYMSKASKAETLEAKYTQMATPDADGARLLADAAERLKLSARGYHRVLRVARTLADLDGAEKIGRLHLAEALSYRALAEDLRRAA